MVRGAPVALQHADDFGPPGALPVSDIFPGRLVLRTDHVPASFFPPRQIPQLPPSNLNTICPYYTMFPPAFPLSLLHQAKPRDWVFDPFCGRGTTIFASRLIGLGCVGIDSNPVAAAIAAAKLAHTTPDAVTERAQAMLDSACSPRFVPSGHFWELCYHPTTLHAICTLREHLLRSCTTPEEILLRALILGILHGPLNRGLPTYLSNQMPRTYATKPRAAIRFWKRTGATAPPRIDVLAALARRAKRSLRWVPPPSSGAVYFADAQQIDSLPPMPRFNWIITSPPYLGMRTYRPDQWLRNWFLGGMDAVDYSSDGEISHDPARFVSALAGVWKRVAARSAPDASLIVRFGSLPSVPVDPHDIIESSLQSADVGWRIERSADAGSANNGKRQSQQFRRVTTTPRKEIDVYATLNT